MPLGGGVSEPRYCVSLLGAARPCLFVVRPSSGAGWMQTALRGAAGGCRGEARGAASDSLASPPRGVKSAPRGDKWTRRGAGTVHWPVTFARPATCLARPSYGDAVLKLHTWSSGERKVLQGPLDQIAAGPPAPLSRPVSGVHLVSPAARGQFVVTGRNAISAWVPRHTGATIVDAPEDPAASGRANRRDTRCRVGIAYRATKVVGDAHPTRFLWLRCAH